MSYTIEKELGEKSVRDAQLTVLVRSVGSLIPMAQRVVDHALSHEVTAPKLSMTRDEALAEVMKMDDISTRFEALVGDNDDAWFDNADVILAEGLAQLAFMSAVAPSTAIYGEYIVIRAAALELWDDAPPEFPGPEGRGLFEEWRKKFDEWDEKTGFSPEFDQDVKQPRTPEEVMEQILRALNGIGDFDEITFENDSQA